MLAVGLELFLHPGQFVALRAFETDGVGRIAVQFDDIVRRDAGVLMQIVDILRDQRRNLAGAVEPGERAMAAARFRLGETLLHDEAPPPGLVAHLAAGHEFVERDRLVLGPQAAGRAEIRNAAFGGDAGAGERHDGARVLDQVAQARQSRSQDRRRSLLYNRLKPGRPPDVHEVSPMRYLHTMLRVRNLDAALDFYCNKLGLKESRRRVDEKNRYTLVFLIAPGDEALVEASKKGRPARAGGGTDL